jgi:hypothetical protein
MIGIRKILAVTVTATSAGLLAGCGTTHPAGAKHVSAPSASATASSTNPALAADSAICKTFNVNIGNGGESVISQALLEAGTSISYPLRHWIAEALTTDTLNANMNAQVHVTMYCAEVKAGVTP